MPVTDEFNPLTHQLSRYVHGLQFTKDQFVGFIEYFLKLLPEANLIFTPLVEIPCLNSGSEYSDALHHLLQDIPNMHLASGFTEKMLLLKSEVMSPEENVLYLLLLDEKRCFVEVKICFTQKYTETKKIPPGHITVENPRQVAVNAEIIKKYNQHELPPNVAPEDILQILARLIDIRTKELIELANGNQKINHRVQDIMWMINI